MNYKIDQAISAGINNLLAGAKLGPEMLEAIKSALNVEYNSGERFRWAHLTLLSSYCVSGTYETALPGAIAMELFALAADIFDDIQDQDHNDLPWRILPNNKAVNLALCLLMLSYDAVLTIPDDRLIRKIYNALNHSGLSAGDGQFQEILYDRADKVTFEQYFELIKRKSGSLTSCACKIGAILGNASEALLLQLEQFGTTFGLMSQIGNDLNDFLNLEKKNDLVTHRKTLPYVYLLNVLQGENADRFQKITRKEGEGYSLEEQQFFKELVVNEGAVHYCTVMYEIFRQKAMEIIKAVSVPEKNKEKMVQLVEKSV